MKRIVSTVLLAGALCAFSASSQAHGTSLSISVGPHGGFGISVGMPAVAGIPVPVVLAPPMPVFAPAPIISYPSGYYTPRVVYPVQRVYAPHPGYRQRVIMAPAAGQRHHVRGARYGHRGY